jgi:phage-related protein
LPVVFFQASPGGRNVIEKFIKNGLKRQNDVQVQLVDQIRVLRNTPLTVLRKNGTVEHIEDEIFSFRFKARIAGNIWIRLLFACFPSDTDIVILLPLLKKTNKLGRDDIRQAKTNLRIHKERLSS